MKLSFLTFLSFTCSACGPITAGGTSAFSKTLEYIRLHGFPKLSALIPGLPEQFSRIEGVESDDAGNPVLPREGNSLGFTADLQSIAGEAKALSVQGFSEARRIETAIQNFAGPVLNVLGRAEVFSQLAGSLAHGSEGLLDSEYGSAIESASDIFDQLVDIPKFAIATGGTLGMPSYLLLGAAPNEGGIEIGGLFANTESRASSFQTGFQALLNFDANGSLSLELSFLPTLLSGLVPDWKLSTCANDIWKIGASMAAADSGENTKLKVSSLECPDARNSVSSIEFLSSNAKSWQLNASFAQNFPGAHEDSLRAFLGSRQGFVVQAAASEKLDKVAAAAAVLREDDFAEVTQDKIDSFGVGRLLTDFFIDKYWLPKRKSAQSGSIFTNYDNISYWSCDAALISSAVQNEVSTARSLCSGKSVDVEDALAFLQSVKKNLRQSSLVPSEISESVASLVDILTVRNSIFVGTDQKVAYKSAPSSDFSELDELRKENFSTATAELSSTSWVNATEKLLPELGSEDIPEIKFKALATPLQKFIAASCNELTSETATRAAKDPETANSKCN